MSSIKISEIIEKRKIPKDLDLKIFKSTYRDIKDFNLTLFDYYYNKYDYNYALKILINSVDRLNQLNSTIKIILKKYNLNLLDNFKSLKNLMIYYKGKYKVCEVCGKMLTTQKKYCSLKCRNEVFGKNISLSLNSRSLEEKQLQIKKCKETMLKRYGVESYGQLVKHDYNTNSEQAVKTRREKNNGNYVSEKYKNECIEKYGVPYTPISKEKLLERNYNYTCNFFNISKEDFLNAKNNFNKEFALNNFIKNGYFDLKSFSKYYFCSYSHAFKLKKILNINIKNYVELGICRSKIENHIFEWIPIENKISNIRSIISPYELDIYLPDYKLAIEYNGSYFHSQVDKNYHKMKTDLCNSKGIQLLHIFDFDDLDIWKSIILNKLGLSKKLYARNCTLKELEYKEVKDFLIENHLQGTVSSSINLGLFYNEELVEVMTFGKSRFDKNFDYELLRLCTKKGLNIIGGVSKLFKYFTSKYKGSIISYANRRFSNGKIYEFLGFTKERISSPNYWYTNGFEVLSRYQSQKYKLNSLLENFDSELSEYENMTNNGYLRIYDCGNIIYKYNK